MKKYFLTCFLMIFTFVMFAQEKKDQNMKVVTDSEPLYPKGEQALYMEVMYKTKYPEEAIKKYVEGQVTLSFDVKTDSTVSNVIVISGVGNGVDEEVKKLVEKLKFAPAVQNGVRVKMNTMYTFPVKAH